MNSKKKRFLFAALSAVERHLKRNEGAVEAASRLKRLRQVGQWGAWCWLWRRRHRSEVRQRRKATALHLGKNPGVSQAKPTGGWADSAHTCGAAEWFSGAKGRPRSQLLYDCGAHRRFQSSERSREPPPQTATAGVKFLSVTQLNIDSLSEILKLCLAKIRAPRAPAVCKTWRSSKRQ